jgi:hypothetical protein
MFEPINLDCITDDPAELQELAAALAYLSNYARLRAKAVHARRQGHIKTAKTAEERAQAIYVLLPEWARW